MHELLADSLPPADVPSAAEESLPSAPEPLMTEVGRFRRGLLVVAVAVLALTACTSGSVAPPAPVVVTASAEPSPSPASAPLSAEQQAAQTLLLEDGAFIVQAGQPSHGGLRFPSQIQERHDQTDRDVGASSVAMALLTLADQDPSNPQWLAVAEKTAIWLTAVSKQDEHGGRYWPDYVDDSGESGSYYTSFDDGAIGIGDFYWRLYEKTNNPEYKTIALQTVQWTLSQAKNVGSQSKPAYRWQWDAGDSSSPYYMGMGEGETGVIETLAVYYQRTKDSDPAFAAQCKRYIEGGLRTITKVRASLADELGSSRYAQAIPETGVIGQDGDTEMDSGYLSGAAGTAYMYLKLYQAFGKQAYLQEANTLFDWLNNTSYGPKVVFADGSAAWKLALDPEGDDNNRYATGVEEGNAGIGWVYLQAHLLARQQNLPVAEQQKYLDTAKQAADWLLKVAIPDGSGGLSWREYENPASPLIHPNLDNGAAGIGTFLLDMYDATGDQRYLVAAQGAQKWLTTSAVHNGGTAYWKDSDDGKPFSGDTSDHWGNGGIARFAARMAGYDGDDRPGEQSGVLIKP